MQFLVTGASGFVGKNLCDLLVQNGHQVMGVTRSERVLKGIQSYTIKNWQDKQEWVALLKGIDVVVHLAARVHIMNDSSLDPISDFRLANLTATQKLAEAVLESPVQKFIFLSSIHVSGTETKSKAFCENDVPSPAGPYAISKYEAEEYLKQIFKNTSLDLVIIRTPLVYGPGCGGNFLSLMKIVQRMPVLPFGRFENKRSLIFVGNLVDFIYKVSFSPAKGSLYLVSDGEDLSFADFLRLLTRLMPKSGTIWSVPKTIIGFMMRCAGKSDEYHKLSSELLVDSHAAARDFSWRPKYSVEEGLRMTVEWYKSNF